MDLKKVGRTRRRQMTDIKRIAFRAHALDRAKTYDFIIAGVTMRMLGREWQMFCYTILGDASPEALKKIIESSSAASRAMGSLPSSDLS